MSNWLQFHDGGGDVIEVIIRESNGAKIDSFKCRRNEFHKVARILENKYGIELHKKEDKDLDWLK